MDLGRGLRRVALLLVPYFGWWAYRGWTSFQDMKAYEKAYDIAYEMSSKHGIGSAGGWPSLISQARADLDQSLLWGAYIPAGLIVGLILVYWVYRGFKRNR